MHSGLIYSRNRDFSKDSLRRLGKLGILHPSKLLASNSSAVRSADVQDASWYDPRPVGIRRGVLDLVSKAARDGAADARDAAIRTWNATSQFASRFVYSTCYTVSYGVVFPAVFLAHSIPRNNAVVRGLVDGAQDAIHKVDQLRSK